MRKKINIITLLCIISYAAMPSLHADLSWSVAPDNKSATATSGSQTYTYNLATTLDTTAFHGPLKFHDSVTNVSWIYNVYSSPQTAFGEWHWQVDDQSWSFDITTQQWGPDNGTQLWNQPELYTWQNSSSNDEWIFSTDDSSWEHNITDQADSVFSEDWTYDVDTNEWSNATRDIVWQFDYETLRWSQTESGELWEINPLIETIRCVTADVPNNRWRLINKNRWVEEAAGIEWLYLQPVDPATSGTWKNTSTEDTWTYDDDTQIWNKDGGSDTAYFPPLTPPLVALQVQDIYRTCASIDTNVITSTAPSGEYVWTSGGNTLRLNSNGDFDMNLSGLSIHLGRGTTYGYSGSNSFETTAASHAEKWGPVTTDSLIDGSTKYTNVSTGISVADIVSHRAATDEWWHSENGRSHVWQYHAATDQWIHRGTGARYVFNPLSLEWSDVGGTAVWKYLYNDSSSKWVWRNLTTGEDWSCGLVSNGQTFTKYWQNTTSGNFTAAGTTTFPTMQKKIVFGATSNWRYDQTTHLWYITTDSGWELNSETNVWHIASPTTAGVDVFPLLPPTMAGYSGFFTNLALNENTSTSPYSDIAGLQERIAANKETLASLQSSFDSITTDSVGYQQYNNLLPLFSDLQDFYHRNLWLLSEQQNLVSAYPGNPSFYSASVLFSTWLPMQGFFSTPGKGAFHITLSTTTAGKPYGAIGLSDEITTDGTAVYTIKFSVLEIPGSFGPEFYFGVTILKGDEELYSQIINPGPADDATFWVTYDDGYIAIGTGDPINGLLVQNATDTMFEYTIDDGATPSTIQYASFRSANGDPTRISPTFYSYDYFSTQMAATLLANQCSDYLRISQLGGVWQTIKPKLITMANDSSYANKKIAALEAIDIALGTNTVLKPQALLSGMFHTLLAGHSVSHFLNTNFELGATTYILGTSDSNGYLHYNATTQNLENAFTALLTADPSTLTADQKIALINTTKTAINNILSIQRSNIGNITASVRSLVSQDGNEDLAGFGDFFFEEAAFMYDLGVALALINPLILERFEQQVSLYGSNDPSIIKTQVDEKEQARQTSRLATISALANNLVTYSHIHANSTLFSTLVAAAITFCINSKFNTIRSTIEAYLSDNGYTDYHVHPEDSSPLHDRNTAFTTLQTILDALEPQLNISGSTFSPGFSGNSQSTASSTAAAYMHSRLTTTDAATLSNQQQSISSGNSQYPNNTFVTTGSNEHVTNHVRELLLPDMAKTEAYSRVYIKDALVALGNGNLSMDSGQSLSVLGAAEITPDGDSLITLNSDLFISGPNFLRPAPGFGSSSGVPTRCIPGVPTDLAGRHRIIFYSNVERMIVVTAGTTLDLTGFGKGDVEGGQQIVFSGKVKLVFEPNARLRLPYVLPNNRNLAPTLLFKDNAQLIFQGPENYDLDRWTNAQDGPDQVRTKILGIGTLKFSDNAIATIMRSALVGIEADYTSNVTDITIELNDQSQWLIGDQNTSGGGFQVGNIIEGGSNNLDSDNYPNNSSNPAYGAFSAPFIPRPTSIDFTLTLNGTNSQFYIAREGFVGFGVGTINKNGNINGSIPDETTDPDTDPDQFNAWNVHSLFNVYNINLNLLNGNFWHHIVANGASSNASLLAFGPQAPRANYIITLNKNKPDAIMGGGNVLFLRAGIVPGDGNGEATPQVVSIWNTVSPLVGGSDDNGKYSILAPPPLFMLRNQPDSVHTSILKYGRAAVQINPTTYQFTGPVDETFLALTFQQPSQNNRYVTAYANNLQNSVAFVGSGGRIQSYPINKRWVATRSRQQVAENAATSLGYLRAANGSPRPQKFIL